MPKETIHDEQFNVEIGWAKDSALVQIATVMAPPRTSEEPQNLCELTRGWIPELQDGAMGLYATLDRQQINELIRILRRARDQAFGRDE